MPTLTDAELKELMTHLSRVVGLNLTGQRVDADLAAYKAFVAANDRVRDVKLPIEAEPFVKLRKV